MCFSLLNYKNKGVKKKRLTSDMGMDIRRVPSNGVSSPGWKVHFEGSFMVPPLALQQKLKNTCNVRMKSDVKSM